MLLRRLVQSSPGCGFKRSFRGQQDAPAPSDGDLREVLAGVSIAILFPQMFGQTLREPGDLSGALQRDIGKTRNGLTKSLNRLATLS